MLSSVVCRCRFLLTYHMNKSRWILYIYIYIYIFINWIYIYIYIVIHRQTVSLYHDYSVWLDMQDASSWDRNPPKFTLDMAYNSSVISVTYVSSRIIKHVYWLLLAYILCYRIPECSFRWRRFALRGWQPLIPSPECSTPGVGSVYILTHRKTLSLCHNSSVWLDTQDASGWDRNSTSVTLDITYNQSAILLTYVYRKSIDFHTEEKCYFLC